MNKQSICDFGIYKGEPYSQLPVSFLNWMIANEHPNAQYASCELNRRIEAVSQSNQGIENN
ncbi:hypothetical protein PALB_18350 [Pseudoalteromonas luteoviolacea B = ATCC 29581]|nr:hypothetical protein PALB_18350 [Pseudoalteromonas luteoviolacea B = ATCC 29581]